MGETNLPFEDEIDIACPVLEGFIECSRRIGPNAISTAEVARMQGMLPKASESRYIIHPFDL